MSVFPKISVVMPIYNTNAKYLKVAIESILGQTFQDFEFIILNDSPNNGELKSIVLQYKDERIKYIENTETLGIPKCYNRLLDLARADFIAIMNHDDYSLNNRLEVQYEYFQSHPEVGLVGSGYKKFGEINRFKKVYPIVDEDVIRAMLLFKSSIHHPTIMIRKSILVENNIRYNEDYVSLNDRQLYYDLSKYTKLANISEVLYKYRFHKNMTSKLKRNIVFAEQCEFHGYWFKDNNIGLTNVEKTIFDYFVCSGRSKIIDAEVMVAIKNVLEKISFLSYGSSNVDHKEFSKVCGEYLLKRLVNATFYGRRSFKDILQKTTLPVREHVGLKVLNFLFKERK